MGTKENRYVLYNVLLFSVLEPEDEEEQIEPTFGLRHSWMPELA